MGGGGRGPGRPQLLASCSNDGLVKLWDCEALLHAVGCANTPPIDAHRPGGMLSGRSSGRQSGRRSVGAAARIVQASAGAANQAAEAARASKRAYLRCVAAVGKAKAVVAKWAAADAALGAAGSGLTAASRAYRTIKGVALAMAAEASLLAARDAGRAITDMEVNLDTIPGWRFVRKTP